MNVNNLYGTLGNSLLSGVGGVGPIGATTPGAGSVPPAAVGAAATATISTPGQFFSQMQQLSQQNPTEFKSVAAQVAKAFQTAASQATGPQAQFLTNLANQFSQASQTGSLQPPQGTQGVQGAAGASAGQGAHHHHHHHGGGGGGAAGGSAQSSAVVTAFQNAISILGQAQGTNPALPATSSSST